MQDAGDKAANEQIAQGAESWNNSARYILQAKCSHLARMGCVVFHYDMIGNADSRALPHTGAFSDPESLLWLHSHMGLQTWNSIRALDFVCELPDVDVTRIGCTGGSGGGTQTFILAALDDRITAAFPAVMISTAMQGGCICENAPYFRLGTGNVEIAGLFAPKPLGMTGANDWTIDIERKGLPELKALYSLYGAADKVHAVCFPQFGHNYNQVSREQMYNWFNTHLKLNLPTPVKERPFTPIPPKELSVYDATHPRPTDELDAAKLRCVLTERARADVSRIVPKTKVEWSDEQNPLRKAVQVMLHDYLPASNEVEYSGARPQEKLEKTECQSISMGRNGQREAVPACLLRRNDCDGTIVVWIHPAGKANVMVNGQPTSAAKQLLDRKAAILAIDAMGTGELANAIKKVDEKYAGYTFGYNRPLLAERVHDILTAIACAKRLPGSKRVHLAGWESAGPWVVLARSVCGYAIEKTAADMDGFRFENIKSNDDPMMLPGALKYGGMGVFAALCAPHSLLLQNHRGTGSGQVVSSAYKTCDAEGKLMRSAERLPQDKVIDWLLAP